MRRVKKIISLLCIVLFVILFFVLLIRLVSISQVLCESQYGPCSQQVFEEVSSVTGKNYFSAKRAVAKKIEQLGSVKTFDTKYIFPNKIKIFVVEKKAEVAAKRANEDYFLFDSDFEVVSTSSQTQLPVLEVADNLPPLTENNPLSEEYKFSLKILMEVNRLYAIKKANLTKDSLEFVKDNIRVIFPTQGDYQALLGSVFLILSRLKEDSSDLRINEVHEIDLRYKNPVLR